MFYPQIILLDCVFCKVLRISSYSLSTNFGTRSFHPVQGTIVDLRERKIEIDRVLLRQGK